MIERRHSLGTNILLPEKKKKFSLMRSKSTCDISDEENFEKESRLKNDGKLSDGKTLFTF